MMNKLLFFLLIYLLGLATYSQTTLGIKAGINVANNVNNFTPDFTDENFRIGYNLGFFSTFSLTELLRVRSEFLVSLKGNRTYYSESSSVFNGTETLNLLYLNLPLLLNYPINQKGGIEFGPELGYLISAKSIRDSEKTDVDNVWDNNFDLGVALGARYDISKLISLDVRYIHGISSVIKNVVLFDEFGNRQGEATFKNRVFQLSVSYTLNK